MARPRVFVSSTYYDLKHLRSSLENFIESFGYDAVLSEKGDIAYTPDIPLDESCYREVRNADIFVLIVGGRYGSARSGSEVTTPQSFFDRYDSITKLEYKSAVEQDIPVYILIERAVHSEFYTFERNRTNTEIKYAHVDSVGVFGLLDDVFAQQRNNPVHDFDHYEDIERWLREQWAGLFRELLRKSSSQHQLASLNAQVAELGEINKTLRRYMETVVSKLAPEQESKKLIEEEGKRLASATRLARFARNRFIVYITRHSELPLEIVFKSLRDADNVGDFIAKLQETPLAQETAALAKGVLETNEVAQKDFDDARAITGRKGLFAKETKGSIESDGREDATVHGEARKAQKRSRRVSRQRGKPETRPTGN